MHEFKRGELKSGKSEKTVTNPRQAVAISLSKAREKGARVPKKKDEKKGYISSACCILANNSMKLGRSLTFDPETGRVPGDDEANALLTRSYRAPWKHPRA